MMNSMRVLCERQGRGGYCPHSERAEWKNDYKHCSFCFHFDIFNNTRSLKEQVAFIESFSYLGFEGSIKMDQPDQTFVVLELWSEERPRKLLKVYFGRFVASFSSSDSK
jgi:tRNA (guanine10-N2)-methyltransferase